MNIELLNPSFEEFKGMTQKQKTLDEIYNYIQEDRTKQIGYLQKYLPLSLVTAFDPKTKEITDIGCSVPNDIINDNFGEMMAKFFGVPGTITANLTDIGGIARQMDVWGPEGVSSLSPFTTTSATQHFIEIQVGSGVTAPTRQDLDIETPFANGGPEDSKQICNDGSYIPGNNTVQVGKVISPTTGGGTATETALFGLWKRKGVNATDLYCLSRDAVSISFLAGQSISVSYIWNI